LNKHLLNKQDCSFIAGFIRLFVIILIFFIFYFQGKANLYAQFGTESHVDAQLISEVSSIHAGKTFCAAVKLKMADHWHIYWRNPGDTGFPTSIEWILPEGFKAGEIKWPYPERIAEPPLVIYGYHGEVFLLTEIKAAENIKEGSVVTIKAKVSWLECAQVCIPGEALLQIDLAVKDDIPKPDQDMLELFANARSVLPLTSSDWRFQAALEDSQIIILAEPPAWFQDEIKSMIFLPYKADIIEYGAKQSFKKTGNSYQLKIKQATGQTQLPDTLKGILFTENGWRGAASEKAIEIAVKFTDQLNVPASQAKSELNNIWLAILFSFLGGIILNLMPCVLPVLSIKIMSFIKQAGEERSKSLQHGLVFTLGVLVSFWVLAGALLILRAGGEQLGWGFQLQSPAFLIILSLFMFLFALSMFGVFEIGVSLTTVAGKTQGQSGLLGSFISGITATVVATPCTAPFMGSALGFSLTQPVWVSLLIFTFLGLGMAAPFLLLSSIPSLLRFVPKPGRWMESLKEFMGFLLLATVIWLIWVLGIQAGTNAVTIVLIALLFAGLAAWIYGRWGSVAMPKRTRIISITAALILAAGGIFFALTNIDAYAVSKGQAASTMEGIEWQTYSEDMLKKLQNDGKPVFIDFTAAWCLSCQVNESVAFSSKEVQAKFKELGIAALKADWTSRDETITRALAKYGRNSVPLYVFYNEKQNSKPVILPEIITPGIVLEAIDTMQLKHVREGGGNF
jgi:thiol:disulfide interchange protein DsbD